MCGISGLSYDQQSQVGEIDIKVMTDLMRRRGPDGSGYFSVEHSALGHRRLRIIDLSETADQPMHNEKQNVSLVFNGEIYNFKELRSDLLAKGYIFRTQSDSEVILKAFEAWGTDSFAKLNGMFAFCILDRRAHGPKFYLVRDRFGIKPLFYAYGPGKMAFASELKPLLHLDWVDKTVNSETLFHYLKLSHVPHPASIVQGVKQVTPGTWIEFTEDGAREGSYNKMSRVPASSISEEEALTQLEQIFKRVLQRQMVSDVPIGFFLSGGIDSSLLVMTAHELNIRPLKTFTIAYKESEFDESSYAREVAKAFNTDHREFVAKSGDFIDIIPDLPDFFDQPLGDTTSLPTLLLSRFTRQEITVAHSGDGGDELFWGYPHQTVLLYSKYLSMIPDGVRIKFFRGMGRLLENRASKFADIMQYQNRTELMDYWLGCIGPIRMDKLAGLLVHESNFSLPYQTIIDSNSQLPWEEQIQSLFMQTFLTNTVLAKSDRASMAFGLETRVPFLDNEMVDFAMSLPFKFKLRGLTSKYILRKLLSQKLPSHLHQRQKQGFSFPLKDWLRTDLKYLLDEYLDEPRLKREGYFNSRQVARLVKSYTQYKANHTHLLWSILMFQMWKERYLDK